MLKAMGKKQTRKKESDSAYFLKLVLYVIIGSQWLWIISPAGYEFPLPLGFVIGILYARHDNFQIDRKIEYAVLLTSALIAFWARLGIFWYL